MSNTHNALVPFTAQFSGADITTVFYNGRPCWMAKDIGRALQYGQDGTGLVTQITHEWQGEITEGVDFAKITGKELNEVKHLLKAVGKNPTAFASQMLVLFESGVNLVCMKTNKPAGQRLRRWLADDVLPQIWRTGTFSSGDSKPPRRAIEVAQNREAIDAAREERLIREMRCRELKELAAAFKEEGEVGSKVILSLRVAAAEIALDEDLSALKPATEDDWLSPTQIAERMGITVARVGRIITELRLRGNIKGLAKAIVNKSRSSNRTVTSYLYSPAAVAQIEGYWATAA